MEGRKLGGRYEVISRVGGGGMAVVYKARDVLLNRHVAIKVLNESLSNDSEFVRRFSREAQAAASLSHPNVVSVYDVGQEGHTHYIVMEYIEGPTLKEYIEQYSPLTAEEIVSIASQICDALSHAHDNQIVHRDIKPHNILLGYNGRAKVTDFGIARASSSSTITQAGSVMGSVHYFSPEQARGGVIGAKSDLYSLGVVMYEMVTGELPYDGDSAISIAMKHLQDPVPDPTVLNSEVPQSIRDIIMRALEKDPDQRFASAREMKQTVDSIFHYNHLNEPQWRNDRESEDESTKTVPAVESANAQASSHDSRPDNGRHKVGDQTMANLERLRGVPADKNKTMLERTVVWLENVQSNMPWWQKILFGLFTIVVIITLAIFTFDQVMGLFSGGGDAMPNLTGQTVEAAEAELGKTGLDLEIAKQLIPDSQNKDTVVKTNPKADAPLEKGSKVTLFVSTGSDSVKIDDFAGKDPDEVKALLEDLGMKVEMSNEDYDPNYDDGQVFKTEPATGEEVKAGDTVTVFVNSQEGKVQVPDFNGQWQTAIRDKLAPEAGIDVEFTFYDYGGGRERGKAYGDSDPAPGSYVERGSTVKVWIHTPGASSTPPSN